MSKQSFFMFILALGLGVAGGYWYAVEQEHNDAITSMDTGKKEKKPLF